MGGLPEALIGGSPEELEDLAGLRVLRSGARRSGDTDRLEAAVDQTIEMLADGIESLRALITDLRPAALDELGIEATPKR